MGLSGLSGLTGLGGTAGGAVDFTALRAARYEEFSMAAGAGANEVGTVAGITLTAFGAPGSTGAGGRTFTVAGSKQLVVDSSAGAPANLSGINTDFSFTVNFTPSGVNLAGTQQIVTERRGPSSTGDLHYILRTEFNAGQRDLLLYIGAGTAPAFSSWTVQAGLTNDAAHHFACSVDKTTREVRYSLDGGAVVSQTATNVPTAVTPATEGFGIGGLGAPADGSGTSEPYEGSVERFRFFRQKISDAWFTLDRADPLNV